MQANNPETIYFAGSGDWTQDRLITVSGCSAHCANEPHRQTRVLANIFDRLKFRGEGMGEEGSCLPAQPHVPQPRPRATEPEPVKRLRQLQRLLLISTKWTAEMMLSSDACLHVCLSVCTQWLWLAAGGCVQQWRY